MTTPFKTKITNLIQKNTIKNVTPLKPGDPEKIKEEYLRMFAEEERRRQYSPKNILYAGTKRIIDKYTSKNDKK